MAKKGIRKSREGYIKRDIRELEKVGVNVNDILKGKDISTVAYTKRGYENYRRHIRALKNKLTTNQQGVKISFKDYKEIKNLENEINKQNNDAIIKYIQDRKSKGQNVSSIELSFIKGESLSSPTYSKDINIGYNLGNVDIFNSINKRNLTKDVLKNFKELYKDFEYTDILDVNVDEFEENFLKLYKDDLSTEQYQELINIFNELPLYQKKVVLSDAQRNSDVVNSELQGSYKGEPFTAILDIVLTAPKEENISVVKRG